MSATAFSRITRVSVYAPGDLVDGRYRIVEQIARGGMATVFEAVDTRLDRHVALKVMHPALAADETYVSRFGREARAAARLSHPNIVAVHDQGEDDHRIFLVMELVRGRTLRQVLSEDGALSPRATLDIAAPLADALSAAHSAGLIHRDIKPENVIIREDGVVKVTDFGLARAVTSETATSATGALLGTVSYLAPEQVESGLADARSDVYAAGLVIFEMLTGSKAFTGDNPMYVAYQHVHAGVPVPSSRLPSIPAALDVLVERTTSRDPMERPVDGNALGHLIRATRTRLSPDELDDRPTSSADTDEYARTHTQVITRAGTDRAETDRAETDRAQTNRAQTDRAQEHRGQTDRGQTDRTQTDDDQSERDDNDDTPLAPLVVRQSGAVVPAAELPPELPRAHRRRGRRVLTILAMLALLGAGALAGWYFIAGPGSPTTVPTVGTIAYEEAVRVIEAADLTAAREDVFDESIPAGIVVSTDPLAGAQLARGREVTLRVSKGQERYAVPTLVDTPAEEAEATLKAAMLTLGERSEEFSETMAAGVIISTDPEAGTDLRRSDPVSIVVSKGRQPIPVPSVAGQSVDAATAAIEEAGLTIAVAEAAYSDSVASGRVISQSPAEGTLFRGETVTVTPSKGPQTVTMPNLVGKQLDAATTELEGLGLKVNVERVLGGYFGSVRAQSSAAGTQVRIGSTITLTIV